jgi:hypothetical protein
MAASLKKPKSSSADRVREREFIIFVLFPSQHRFDCTSSEFKLLCGSIQGALGGCGTSFLDCRLRSIVIVIVYQSKAEDFEDALDLIHSIAIRI